VPPEEIYGSFDTKFHTQEQKIGTETQKNIINSIAFPASQNLFPFGMLGAVRARNQGREV